MRRPWGGTPGCRYEQGLYVRVKVHCFGMLWALRLGRGAFRNSDLLLSSNPSAVKAGHPPGIKKATLNIPHIPRGPIYTTIMELGHQNHNGDGLIGPNAIMVVYMDPLGLSVNGLQEAQQETPGIQCRHIWVRGEPDGNPLRYDEIWEVPQVGDPNIQ